MLTKSDAQRMAISYNELLSLRDKYILWKPGRSDAFNLFGELVGYYHNKRSFVELESVVKSRPWDVEEVNAYKKKPNALIYDNCCWQEVAGRALAYMDKHLTPVLEGYGTGYACKQWGALMNVYNSFLFELLIKMMFTESNAIYYSCVEKCCLCLDTSKALKPLRLIER